MRLRSGLAVRFNQLTRTDRGGNDLGHEKRSKDLIVPR